ncbi:hypothetical protein HDU91_002006, partial [Kappamyces sp. JEL0680]
MAPVVARISLTAQVPGAPASLAVDAKDTSAQGASGTTPAQLHQPLSAYLTPIPADFAQTFPHVVTTMTDMERQDLVPLPPDTDQNELLQRSASASTHVSSLSAHSVVPTARSDTPSISISGSRGRRKDSMISSTLSIPLPLTLARIHENSSGMAIPEIETPSHSREISSSSRLVSEDPSIKSSNYLSSSIYSNQESVLNR